MTGLPNWGGAVIKAAGTPTKGCSSGFGAHSRTNGSDYVLTAEHCVNNADRRFWDGGNDYMGQVTNQLGQYDVAAIKVAEAPYSYVGSYTSGSGVAVDAVVRPSDFMYMAVCTSGAFSGTQCNGAHISAYYHWGRWCTEAPGPACFSDLILWDTEQDSHDPALAGHGDSGGPVYINPVDTGGQYFAVGLIHGPPSNHTSWTQQPCRGIAGPPCSNGISFSDVYTDAQDWNLSLTQ